MGITHLTGLQVAGVPTMGMGGTPPFTGDWWFVDYYRGSDGNTGAADQPFQTIYRAYQAMNDGGNDVCVIMPSPISTALTNGTQRSSYALAYGVDNTATSGMLTWAKNACHLIGISGPGPATKARIAPPTGTYTAATWLNGQTVGSTPMVNVTASGCVFANFSINSAFSTGNAGFITWKDIGGNNYYYGVEFQGQADAASAGGTASRTFVLGSDNNVFQNCTFGTDTVGRGAATRTLEIIANATTAAGSGHNTFMNCNWPVYVTTSGGGTLSVYTAGTGTLTAWTKFDNCTFLNCVTNATYVAQSGIIGIGASAAGFFLLKNCTGLGIVGAGVPPTVWGDATTLAQMYIDGASPTAATSGKAVQTA